jgi:hypothetical protein
MRAEADAEIAIALSREAHRRGEADADPRTRVAGRKSP